MDQSVQSRVSHDWIWKQWDPILGWSVTGDDDRRLQVTFGHDLVEIFCLGRGECGETEVIDDEQIGGQVFLHPLLPGVIGTASQQVTEEFDGLDEEDLISQTASLMSQGLSQVAFPYSCRAIKQNMLFLFDKTAVSEIPNEFCIELGIEREVKPLQCFFFFEGGPGESEAEFFGFSAFDLILDQKLEEFDMSQRRTLGLLETEILRQRWIRLRRNFL